VFFCVFSLLFFLFYCYFVFFLAVREVFEPRRQDSGPTANVREQPPQERQHHRDRSGVRAGNAREPLRKRLVGGRAIELPVP
jgi:hypothetical protein